MSKKINDKILSIPPYISTSWSRVAALHMKGSTLAITLVDGDTIQIPNLDAEHITLIFQYHSMYLEQGLSCSSHPSNQELSKLTGMMEQIDEPAIRLAFGSPLEGLGTMMQHNPNQADAPNLPPDILQKISAIAKIVGPPDEILMPKAETGCNCFYCQIARVLDPVIEAQVEVQDEISEKELQFQQWTITQTGEQLYAVTNRLDEHEKYNVFLGHPVGCTCGKSGCEHILAVLKS